MDFVSQFFVKPFDIDFNISKGHAIIKYGDYPVSYEKAVKIYYGVKDAYLTWEFDFSPISLKERKNDYVVLGDGVRLGTIRKNQKPEFDNDFQTLHELLNQKYVYGLKCDVFYSRNFRLTKEEYEEYVKDDPFSKGYAHWASSSSPKRIMLYVTWGAKKLTKAEEYLRNKQALMKKQQ